MKEKIHFWLEVEDKYWKESTKRWVNPKYHWGKCSMSSSKTIHDESEALKEFDKLTKKGIICTLTRFWRENGVGWYTEKLHSKDQEYFNNPDYKLKLKDTWE